MACKFEAMLLFLIFDAKDEITIVTEYHIENDSFFVYLPLLDDNQSEMCSHLPSLRSAAI
jgi:hypothetical protein